MRPKIIFAILLVAVLAVGVTVWFKTHSNSPAPVAVPAMVTTTPPTKIIPAPVVVKKNATPEEKQKVIEDEKDKLYAWSMSNDPQSLSNIVGDLTSPEKEVREAAIEATKQFGDTNAIPVLKALAANTQDNQEAIEMLEAADFLALPDVQFVQKNQNTPETPAQAQALEASKAKAQARRAAYLQNHGKIQNAASSASAQSAQNPTQSSAQQ